MDASSLATWLRGKGWIPLLLLAIINHVLLTAFVAGLAVELRGPAYAALTRIFLGIAFLVAVFAIAGLYYDRRYVSTVSDWSPSAWYFLMFFVPFVGYFVTILYLFRRHRRIGVP